MEEAARSTRYAQIEIDSMPFEGSPPSVIELSQRWKRILHEAREIVDVLPASATGACILDSDGNLLRCGVVELQSMLKSNEVRFHTGCIRGAYPTMLVK